MISNSYFSLWSQLCLNNFSKVEERDLHCAGIFIFSLLTVFDENESTNHQSLFISLHKSRTRTENQNLKETWNVRNIIQVFLNPEGHVCQCTFTFRWSSLNSFFLTKNPDPGRFPTRGCRSTLRSSTFKAPLPSESHHSILTLMFNLSHAQCAPPCMHCMWIYVICVHIDVTTFHVWISTICTENLKVWPTVSLRSLSFKSRSNWLSAHVSIFFKLNQGDQMCGQIWAMCPKNQKLRKLGQQSEVEQIWPNTDAVKSGNWSNRLLLVYLILKVPDFWTTSMSTRRRKEGEEEPKNVS